MHSLLPDATTWALALSGGLLLTLMAAATGLPFMALAGQTLATARRRVFYDKCARQLAMLVAVLSLTSPCESTALKDEQDFQRTEKKLQMTKVQSLSR